MSRLRQQFIRISMPLIAAAAIGCRGAEGPAGPPGGGTLITAAGTGSLILDDDVFGFKPLPGVAVTVTGAAGRGNGVLIETDGGVQVNSVAAASVCIVDVAVFVDDAQVGPGRRILVSNTSEVLFNVGSFGLSVTADLAPGPHTIAVRAKNITPLAGVQCYVSSGADVSGLPGRPQLQAVLNVLSLP